MDFLSDFIPFSTDFMGAGALLLASFTSLFSVVNPLAAMPVFLSLMGDHTLDEQVRTARKSAIYMFIVLVTFLFLGTYILSFLVLAYRVFALPAEL